MVDITITAANVLKGGNATVESGTAGAAITAGQVVFKNSSSEYALSDADDTTLDEVDGIALHAAADGQPLDVQTAGDITIGGTLVAGTPYFLSATAGGICPHADLVTGDRVIQIGIAKSTTVLALRIVDTGVILA